MFRNSLPSSFRSVSVLLLALLVFCPAFDFARADALPFAKGADVGWLSEMESEGVKFYDADGNAKDCLQILKDHGINSIRLRVWVNPANQWLSLIHI